MEQIRWIITNMSKKVKIVYVFALISTVFTSAMQLINPIITQKIVDQVVKKLPYVKESQMQDLISTLISLLVIMIVFTIIRTVTTYCSIMSYEKCAQEFLYEIRDHIYKNLQRQDAKFFSQNRTGDLMTRLTGDMDMIRHTICWVIRMLVECICLFLATTIYMLSKDVLFTLSLLVVTPFIYIVTKIFSKQVRPLYINLREKLSLLNTNAQENISGNRVVKAFAREEFEMQKFEEKNEDYKQANLKATMKWLQFFPIIEGLSQAMQIAVLLVGGLFIINGRITAGVFLAFSSLSWTLSNPVRMLGTLLNDLQRFFASCDKVIELYYASPKIKNKKDAIVKEERAKGEIDFKDVTVKISGTEVLKNINLHIKAGETLAIMGSTGSGKTTLLNSIARIVDISSGSLTVDGIEVKQYDLHSLRKNIGMASQEVFLFSDTIDSNIAYGDLSLTEEEVKYYAQLADANFIEKTADGYDTLIGERGTGLSGGQKQRLALARALAIKPPILILDDTTSAVDLETEKKIQNSLRNLEFECTKIIVAQRISTTKTADHILVLDKGEIIEYGTHEELIKNNGYYKEVFDLQNGNANEERGDK